MEVPGFTHFSWCSSRAVAAKTTGAAVGAVLRAVVDAVLGEAFVAVWETAVGEVFRAAMEAVLGKAIVAV